LEVLDFFAAHPSDSANLSELSRTLEISPASLLAILQSLTDAGYLIRHTRRKTYRLGPKSIAVGHAALTAHPVVDWARSEMPELAKSVNAEVVATSAAGEFIIVLATAGRPRLTAPSLRVGQQIPFIPPIGPVFLAWADEAEVEAWQQRLLQTQTRPSASHLHAALAATRRRGYSVGLATPEMDELGRSMQRLADRPKDIAARAAAAEWVSELGDVYELVDPDPGVVYPVANIAAPVFGSAGEVTLALTVDGLGPLDADEISAVAGRITGLTRLLTKRSGGREPDDYRAQ
jgi:DNA-binding IclR family transcriptional regulator